MLENTTTVRAESVDKAIEKGLQELNLSLSEVDVHVISEGKKGIFGFGKQDAIVELTEKNDLTLKEITEQLEDKEAKLEAQQTEDVPEPVKQEIKPERIKETKVKEVKVQKPKVKAETAKPQVAKEEVKAQDSEEKQLEEEGLTLDESSRQVGVYIEQVIREYGAQADVEYEISGNKVIFNIDTDKSGLVIGKHGKIINSLQVLTQTLLQSLYRRRVSVLLNVGDYRDRRAYVLEQIAQRTADDVLRTKQPVILDPLPSYERKQIHAYLSRIDRIKTHSEGKEPNRYLVVEYD